MRIKERGVRWEGKMKGEGSEEERREGGREGEEEQREGARREERGRVRGITGLLQRAHPGQNNCNVLMNTQA